MKKIIALLLALVMALSLCACGKTVCSVEGCENEAVEDATYDEPYCSKHLASKKAFDVSKEAYDNINSAYLTVEKYGSDIYEAWRLGIYEDDEILDDGCKHLATELNLSEAELLDGLAYTIAPMLFDKEWDELSEEEKDNLRGFGNTAFSAFEDDLFSFCVMVASNAYITNGKVAEVQECLSQSKTLMKELSDLYSDYEHYPALKGYYTTTSSFFDFCQNPTGSFEQIKTTTEDYKSTARDYKADLDYIFED